MAPSTQYAQEYQQAVSAYMKGGYQEAAAITDQLVENYPDDPNLRLLRGHVYCCLQQYETAREQYQMVLGLTADPEVLECANHSLVDTEHFRFQGAASPQQPDANLDQTYLASDLPAGQPLNNSKVPEADLANRFDSASYQPIALQGEERFNPGEGQPEFIDPFSSHSKPSSQSTQISRTTPETDLFAFVETPSEGTGIREDIHFSQGEPAADTIAFEQPLIPIDQKSENNFDDQGNNASPGGSSSNFEEFLPQPVAIEDSDITLFMAKLSIDEGSSSESTVNSSSNNQDASVGNDSGSASTNALTNAPNAFDFSDDLGNLPDFLEQPATNSSDGEDFTFVSPVSLREDTLSGDNTSQPIIPNQESHQGIPSQLQHFNSKGRQVNPTLTNRGGFFSKTSLRTKQLITAGMTGLVSAVAVVAVSQMPQAEQKGPTSRLTDIGLVALAAGVAGGITTFGCGQLTTKQIKRTSTDLQSQFDAVALGNLGAKATVYSQDELGQLAGSFNQMTQTISSIISSGQRRAEEQEKVKEELQRQVIRLLDDVEGAARGDLTVQAEVTADVLGAVADSFNLTIQNLQKLVQQVKVAAQQVGKGAAENETFARDLSVDALRQAEELAVTLNSVQMMTNAIQRVAESAREADKVAREASTNALKGGDAVAQTVAAILQIRGTVAQTTRKVKRLGESTQEINKFVGVIAQIASRTNLLALNASIEAARAGEAGRGFATVADEVRQLADRAGKSSKEIEQIVLQIQSETGQVMMAMEEGTQQVIEGTRLAEQAKQSLEDIIQVSSQIDALVSSITAATVEQTETSRSMAQVMQTVELTAQETSQEAQRVSSSLEHLVGVAQALQASVERFKLESTEIS